jgi:hypothetical protein
MSIALETSDTVFSTRNTSILSVSNLAPLPTSAVQPSTLLSLYDYLFNTQQTEISGDEALSLLNYICSYLEVETRTPIFGSISLQYLRGILVQPLLMFQASNSVHTPAYIFPGIKSTGVYGKSSVRVVIEKWTVAVYTTFTVVIYIWCISSMLWATTYQGPPTTQFALLDFAERVAKGHRSVSHALTDTAVSARDYREKLQSKVIFLGNVPKSNDFDALSGDEMSEEYEAESGRQANIGRIGFAWNKKYVQKLKR